MNTAVSGSYTDELLVASARKGDVRAFERLYREHLGRVYGLCLRMTGNVAQAEDCTQQAFIKAWGALKSFETRSTFGTWLHRIAVNVVLGQRRSRKEQPPVEPLEPLEDSADAAVLDTPVEIEEIEEAIASLPPGARDVLVLAGIYGHSHGEVAQMLGIAEGTCKAQLHRARQMLRDRLEIGDD
jgi:RNA polymerase sigma-70 factor (ECF subfamily)